MSCVLFISVLPFNTMAAQNNSDERAELILLACEVFPEYADKINNQTVNTNSRSSTSENRELVLTETRNVSENESLIYSEYSDGVILLTDYAFEKELTIIDRVSSSYAVNVTMNIEATCTNVSGYFLLEGVKYSLINGAYDVINDEGTATATGKCRIWNKDLFYSYVPNETASQNACITYRLGFQIGASSASQINSRITLTVGDNSATVTHVDDT